MIELAVILVLTLLAIYIDNAIVQIILMSIVLAMVTIELMYLIIKYIWKEDI